MRGCINGFVLLVGGPSCHRDSSGRGMGCFGNNIGQTLENYINQEETDNFFLLFLGGRKEEP